MTVKATSQVPGVTFSPDGQEATHVVGNGNTFHLRRFNGVYYHDTTPEAVIRVLDEARRSHLRVRLHYGYTEAKAAGTAGAVVGRDWLEEYGVTGYVSNSMGPLKIPILLSNAHSTGGGPILDDCIVKITTSRGGRSLYQHPSYSHSILTVREIAPDERVGERNLRTDGYTHTVCADGAMHANFKSLAAAERFVKKWRFGHDAGAR